MELRKWLLFVMVVAAFVALGCSGERTGDVTGIQTVQIPPGSDGDSVPPDSVPPPPEPPVVQPAVWVGSDTAAAGGTANVYWRVGNETDAPATISWSVAASPGWTAPAWPVFPITGGVAVPAHTMGDVVVPIDIPASAASGFYFVQLSVVRPSGDTYSAEAGLRVHP